MSSSYKKNLKWFSFFMTEKDILQVDKKNLNESVS